MKLLRDEAKLFSDMMWSTFKQPKTQNLISLQNRTRHNKLLFIIVLQNVQFNPLKDKTLDLGKFSF